MSWIRIERNDNPAGTFDGTDQFDGVCEAETDLTAERSDGYAAYGGSRKVLGVGSTAYCLVTQTLYIKTADGSWATIGGGGGSAEEEEAAG